MSSMIDSISESAMQAFAVASNASLSLELFSSVVPLTQPNGLHNFIKEVRDSKTKEQERSRVDKELGNIRKKFSQSSNLTSYQKKKYVWKMCYIYMLGYEVDFGYMEFISLLSSLKFQEKSVGYMAVALFLKPGDELMTLVVNSIRNDIISRSNFGQTLALAAVSNIGGSDLAEALAADVQKLLMKPYVAVVSDLHTDPSNEDKEYKNHANVVKKSALCLMRLYRTNPDCVAVGDWIDKLNVLLNDRDMGIITSIMSFLISLAAVPENYDLLLPLLPSVITILTRLTVSKACGDFYIYYKIASPWIQVKCLKFLQYFDFPDNLSRDMLTDALISIVTKVSDTTDTTVNKTNAEHAILYEAITLIINYGPDAGERLRTPAFAYLGKFLSTSEANIRYIGLDLMNYVLKREEPSVVRLYQNSVIESLKDTDVSVRKRALENIFSLTDEENVREIIDELLVILASADSGIKEDFVVKIAILTEKFYQGDLVWYLDTMVKMLLIAGEYAAEAIWHRVVVIVTNHSEVHDYAAEKLFDCVRAKYIPDVIIALSAYLLGEIGINICEKSESSGYEQFAALHQHFQITTTKTQSILLTSYVKLMNLYPDTKDAIMEIFQQYAASLQLEIQQRSCEYLKMPTISAEIMEQVLNTMPPYSEEKENELLSIDVAEKDKEKIKSAWTLNSTASVPISTDLDDTSKPEINSPKSHVSNTHKSMDLLSLESDELEAVSPMSVRPQKSEQPFGSIETFGVPPDDEPLIQRLFLDALIADQNERCVLYENGALKLSVMSEFKNFKGVVTVFIYNKSNCGIQNLQLQTNSLVEVQAQCQSTSISSISSGEEVTILVSIECYKPFKQSITLAASFEQSRNQYKYELKLPVTMASFNEPVPSDKFTYMSRWKALENEVQEIFPSGQILDRTQMLHIRNVVFPRLKIGLASELDQTEKTSTGSFSFQTGTRNVEGNNCISVGGMLRLECDSAQNRFRVTIRSKHIAVSEGIRDILKTILM